MPRSSSEAPSLDAAPSADPAARSMRREVLAGLRARPKTIPSKYLYDERGSALFDRITELDEYYPTRTEVGILNDHVGEMAACIGPRALVVEYGSGSARKTRILLDHLERPAGYVPIDISGEHLRKAAERLRDAYPALRVEPVAADYTQPFELPHAADAARVVVYFPGSTIGNFTPDEARAFLRRIAGVAGPGGGLLIGVDLRKDRAVLEAAYDDREGVTAAFNLNLLRHVNRVLGANFRLERFAHRAVYDADEGRIEMHLVSLEAQTVRVAGEEIRFEAGETIHTENSYKYTLDGFAALAASAGLRVERVWTDAGGRFSVQYLATI